MMGEENQFQMQGVATRTFSKGPRSIIPFLTLDFALPDTEALTGRTTVTRVEKRRERKNH